MTATHVHIGSAQASCLLCKSARTRCVQRISGSALAAAYRDGLGVQIQIPPGDIDYCVCEDCELRFFAPPVTGDEAFYESLQRIPWYYAAEKQEFKIAARYVDSKHDVLEIGAGRGLFAREIKPASYTGLEFSASAIELAAKSGIELLARTIEQHAEMHAEHYDVVCSFQVLEHVADPRSFLAAAARCLKPAGRLIVSVPGEDSFARHAYWDVLNMPPHHVTRWTDRCLRGIARICGLRFLELIPEPLGRNMRGPYANAAAAHWLSGLLGIEAELLDGRLKRGLVSAASRIVASIIKRRLAFGTQHLRGHAVVAVFEKLRD